MSQKKLERDLKYGLGRAYIFLKNQKNYNEYMDVIEKVVLNYNDYDHQSEGERGRYLSDIITLIKKEDYFIDLISIKLFSNKTKKRDIKSSLLDVLKFLSLKGNQNALLVQEKFYDYIYNRIKMKRIRDHVYYEDFTTFSNLVMNLCDFKDFKFIETVVKDVSLLSERNKFRVEEYMFDYFSEKYSVKAINKLLVKYKVDYLVKKVTYPKNKENALTIEQFMEGYNEKSPWRRHRLANRFSKSSHNDLLLLTNILENETIVNKQKYYLTVFEDTKYCGKIQYLINQYQRYDEDYDEILTTVLSKIRSKKVEKFALNILDKNELQALLILAKNLNENNLHIFIKSLNKINFYIKTEHYHWFIRDICKIICRNKLIDTKVILKLFYAQKCSYCRYDMIQTVFKHRELSNDFKQELFYDCYEDTTLLVKKSDNFLN